MYLPRCGKRRRPYGKAKEFLRGWTKHVRSIRERPRYIEKRERVGDWEGDTVVGADRTRLLVHIERKSRFVVADLVASGNADIVATRVVKRFKKLPAFTITCDRDCEFALWRYVQEELSIRVFFAEPHHPWERGTCENTNGLIGASCQSDRRSDHSRGNLSRRSRGISITAAQVPQVENAVSSVRALLSGDQRAEACEPVRWIVGPAQTFCPYTRRRASH